MLFWWWKYHFILVLRRRVCTNFLSYLYFLPWENILTVFCTLNLQEGSTIFLKDLECFETILGIWPVRWYFNSLLCYLFTPAVESYRNIPSSLFTVSSESYLPLTLTLSMVVLQVHFQKSLLFPDMMLMLCPVTLTKVGVSPKCDLNLQAQYLSDVQTYLFITISILWHLYEIANIVKTFMAET